MLRISFLKMWHKKWINLCLLIGCVLLVAKLTSFALYEHAAYNRMLQDEFVNYMANEGSWPTINTMVTYSKKDKEGKTIKKMEKFVNKLDAELGVNSTQIIDFYTVSRSNIQSEMNRSDLKDVTVRLGFMTDVQKHVNMLYGDNLSESGITDDGAFEVIITEACLVEKGLLLGETLKLENISDKKGKPVRIKIVGVFDTANNDDFYWQIDKLDQLNVFFMREDLFRDTFLGDRVGKYSITCEYYHLFSYKDLTYQQVDSLVDKITYMTTKSGYRSVFGEPVYLQILKDYQQKQTRISATLQILQIPVLIMLAAFLFMISGQMYEMEKNEISVIKSRGSYGRQIFYLYLFQNLMIVTAGGLIGFPLGRLFASVLGATRNFLEFDTTNMIQTPYTLNGVYYAGAGMLFCLLCLTLPAIKHSRLSIVHLKQQRAARKKPLWEKLFLDVILLGISLYGYYSFHKNVSAVSGSVMSGESLDPLLYISSSLFILGSGLLFLRLQPYIVKLIYVIGYKFWGPSGYISFMENGKNGKKQQMIMLFMIMTISLGMYHATVARTILDNALENREYLDGADVIIREKWEAIIDENGATTGKYVEPDFQKYMAAPFAEDCTRVYFVDSAYMSESKSDRTAITVYGIHTKDFGSMTSIDSTLNEKPYYEYLNELAVAGDGILVSRNFAKNKGYEVGDYLNFKSPTGIDTTGKIIDFVDYWPGFATTISGLNADGTAYTQENYLVVMHYEYIHQHWTTSVPYEIWINLKDDCTNTDVYNYIQDHSIQVRKYVNKEEDISEVLQDPLLQGTNGVLTLGFAVTIILCGIGYLIYWIMSVKERELIFGVLRACGFHKGEVIRMLLTEQLFSGVFSCIAGIGIGTLTSRLFVPILQQAYASADQTLPMRMITEAEDLYRLYGVIAGVMIVCLVVLITILQRMNITKALKLGEE